MAVRLTRVEGGEQWGLGSYSPAQLNPDMNNNDIYNQVWIIKAQV